MIFNEHIWRNKITFSIWLEKWPYRKICEIIARNEIIALLNLEEWKDTDISSKIIPEYPNEILKNICNWAVENKIIEDTIAVRDLFDTKIMGKITPSATHVIDKFIKISNLVE